MKWKYHSLLINISPPVRHNILLRIREMGGISWEISRKQIIFIFGNKFQDFPASLQAKFLCWLSWYPNIFFQTCSIARKLFIGEINVASWWGSTSFSAPLQWSTVGEKKSGQKQLLQNFLPGFHLLQKTGRIFFYCSLAEKAKK